MIGSNFPILSRLLPAPVATPVIPVDDDPLTLARLAAIMSDRIRPCQTCGRDPHVCRAIGCGTDDAPLLSMQAAVDLSADLDRVWSSPALDLAPVRYGIESSKRVG